MKQWFQDSGHQAMKDSDPWNTGNNWSEPCDCSNLLPYDSFQILVQRWEIQEESGRFLKLNKMS